MSNQPLRHWPASRLAGLLSFCLLPFALCLLPLNSALAQKKIMPLGNSITAGAGSTHGGGYRLPLFDTLNNDSDFGPFNFVGSQSNSVVGMDDEEHEGHPGFLTAQLEVEDYLTDNPADIVLLEIGTNDLSANRMADAIAASISDLVDRIHATTPNATIMLGTLLPVIDDNKNVLASQVNLLLPDIVNSRFSRDFAIYLVDHYSRFVSNGNWQNAYMSDELHPSDRGYEIMAEEWYATLRRTVVPTRTEFRDGFDGRSEIGPDWTANIVYEIDGDQLVNAATETKNDKWDNFFAICNVVVDPNIIEMKYGYRSDNVGRAFTGLALKLTGADMNASGYLVHHYYDKLRLWAITNGVLSQIISEVGSFPETQIDDVFRVEIRTNESGHHFVVSRNGQALATLDDPQKRFNGIYAGIMINGNTNNGVDEFYCIDTRDLKAPAKVSDLLISAATYSTLTLEWTAPGDDNFDGKATSYDLRYSTAPITSDNDFASATPVPESIEPGPGGALERLTVGGLESGKTYHFAIKARDDQDNLSPLSNDASSTTASLLIFKDTFNRADGSLGENWGGDVTNLQIRSGTAQNIAVGDIWSTAVFKNGKNAVEVTVKYGTRATPFGINFSGVLVMADGPGPTPLGYMIQHYSNNTPDDLSDDETRLWLIQNGRPFTVVDQGRSQSGSAPKPGSRLTVRVIKENNTRYFYVYLDDKFDRVLSDPLQRFNGLYSGFVMESRLGEQNAVDEITFGAAPVGAKALTKDFSTDNQIASIQQPLPLPLKVTVVDSFDNALAGATVKFAVTSGNAKLTSPPSPDGKIRLEAEDVEYNAPLEARNDPDAAGGKYLVYPAGKTGDAAATFNFEITTPGTYYVWTRSLRAIQPAGSWDVRADNGTFFIYDVFRGSTRSTWTWDLLAERGPNGTTIADPKTFAFGAGPHRLVFRVRFEELRLDKILLTTDPAFVPGGKEESGFTTNANGEASAILTLGDKAGPVTIQASHGRLLPVTFTATATGGRATKIAANGGSGQSGAAGQTLQPFKVLVQDDVNNPVAGQQVTWVVTAGNGTLSQYTSTSGLDGLASTILTLGNSGPSNTVEARTSLLGTPTFTATTTSGVAARLASVSSPQNGTVHTALASSVVAKVTTATGVAVAKFPVEFRVVRGGGSLSPIFVISNGGFEDANSGTTTPLNWNLENSPNSEDVLLSTSAPRSGTKSVQISSGRDGVGISQSVNYPAIGSYTLSFYVKVFSGTARVSWRMNDAGGNQIEKVIDITALATGNNWTPYVITADNGGATPRSVIFKTLGAGNFFIDEVKVFRNTDINGQISINWTLGDTAMTQVAQAEAKVPQSGTNLNGSPLSFSVKANAGAAKSQRIQSGNNQSGSANQTLSAPLVVKVVDQYGNGISGRTVNFKMVKGDGRINNNLLNVNQPTDANGLAQVTYKLGPVSGDTNKVEATSTGLNKLTFSALAAIPNKVTKAGTPTAGSAGKRLSSPLVVKVTDAGNKIIAGYPVIFLIKQGNGKLNNDSTRIAIPTDLNGQASVFLTLGPAPNTVNRVEAYVMYNGQKLPNPVLSFSVKSAPLKELVMVGATNNQAGPACEPLPQALRVKVTDSLNVGVRDHLVTFVVTKGGGKFGNLDSIKVKTDTSGFAQAALTLGPKPGQNQAVARAAVKLTGSPMTFTATARVGAAATMNKVSGDSLFSLINGILPTPQVVRLTDKCGNVIAGANVKFKVKAGGGKVNGQDSVTVSTAADGRAQITWKLGNVSGIFNNQIEARAFNGANELANSPIIFMASATPTPARKIAGVTAPNVSGQAGATLSNPLAVKVTDNSGNGILGHPVQFLVTKGGGRFSNGQSQIEVTTDQLGVAKATWTLGGTIGNNSQEVRVIATNGGANLDGVPVIFTANVTSGPPCADGSEIKATGPIQADGVTKSQITVHVRDCFGNPLPGKAVTLIISPSGSYFIDQPTNLTNAQGLVTGAFAAISAGTKTVTAKVLDSGTELNNGATVQVSPLAASQMSLISGNNQTCNVRAALANPLVVKVADRNGNGVPNYEVRFTVKGDGRIFETGPIRTDEKGWASASYVGSTAAGQSQIWAESTGLSNSPVIFIANVSNNPAREIKGISGNAQKGPVGQALPEPLVVRVTDRDGRPVFGTPVRFDVTFGGGAVNESAALNVNTNEFGEARVNLRLGPNAGPNTVRVTSNNLQGSPVDFLATAEAGRAARLVIYSGHNGVGEVGGNPPPLCVHVTDASGNGVDGVEVMFELVRGTGTFSPGSFAPIIETTTRDGGFACATLTLGQDVGYRHVRATSSGLGGSPATFSVYGRAMAAQSMSADVRTNNQRGTKGKVLNFPLQVYVKDRNGNPVVNYAVDFLITSGGGSFNGSNPFRARTDSTGVASAPWTLGRFAADNEATAVASGGGNVQPATIIFKATGFDNNFPLFEDVVDRRVNKGDVIEFTLLASDPDGDPLTYGAKNLPPGAQFDSLSSRIFRWSTGASNAGQYAISFLVRDNKGGTDEELVLVDVKNRNRPPFIMSRFPVGLGIPTQRDTVIDFNTTLLMRVNATDQDNDALNYRWFLNGKYAGSAVSTYLFRSDERFNTVEVLVFDQEDTTTTSWLIQVPVKLATFSAAIENATANGAKAVKLEWRTSAEVDNAGFNILRGRSGSGRFEKINQRLIPARQDGQYIFVDDNVDAGGRYYYKLEAVDLSGNVTLHGPVNVEVTAPQSYVLQQNYPNPFNPTTQIRYELPKSGRVVLSIYNSLGQEVRRLVEREQSAGYHLATWNGRDQQGKPVPSGVYHYRLQVGDYVATKRMVMAK
ncbi:MAG: Ig-like domain-containing protein [bacterium]